MNLVERDYMETRLKRAEAIQNHIDELELALSYIETDQHCTVTLQVDRAVGGRRAIPVLFKPRHEFENEEHTWHPAVFIRGDVRKLLTDRLESLRQYYKAI